MKQGIPTCLVSPLSGIPLEDAETCLKTEDGAERFEIRGGIAYLLDRSGLDEFRKKELETFDSLSIRGVHYFRRIFLKKQARWIGSLLEKLPSRETDCILAEMGGGEGFWADAIKKEKRGAQVFVCDLSMNTLKRAPGHIKRVCADITRPIFRKGSLSLAAFWVSLHHLSSESQAEALGKAAEALAPGGILLFFEPNMSFFPRRIVLNTRLSRDVYLDEHERSIDFSGISETLGKLGMTEETVYYVNPPYNRNYVRKLKNWHVYMTAVELMYQLEKWILAPLFGKTFSQKQSRFKRYLSLYGFFVYRKKSKPA